MNLRYIELFHAVLMTGSLTGAAKLLNVSQPAASKALQHAEGQLGFALFSRVRGRLQPTQQALQLRHSVDRIMHDLNDLQRLTANMSQPENQRLRVTCTPTLAIACVPDAMVLLRESFPAATAELFTQHSTVMSESLALREADLGFTLQDTDRPNLSRQVLCRGQIVVIAPPGWWTDKELARPLSINELNDQPLIGLTIRDRLGSMLQSHLAQVDSAPRISFWVQTYQLAYALVAQGEGLALVDPFTACRGGTQPVQVRALESRMDVALYALYRSDSPLNPVQKCFIGAMRQLARKMLATI